MWFPNRSDTNQAVQSAQKMATGLQFRIKKVDELYYLCSENKGADQLRSYCEADLRLCFRICRLLVFSRGGSFVHRYRPVAKYGLKIFVQCIIRTFYSKTSKDMRNFICTDRHKTVVNRFIVY